MRTPVRLSCDDNDILLKKTISRISNVSKTSFKKNLFVLGRTKMRSGQAVTEKLTTTWLTFTRAYLPWQGYFIKEGSFLSPQNIKWFFLIIFQKLLPQLYVFRKNKVVNWCTLNNKKIPRWSLQNNTLSINTKNWALFVTLFNLHP